MRRLVPLAAALAAAAVVPFLAAAGRGSPASAAAGPTYYGAVAPILAEHCTSCHRVGGVAPFSLASAKDASTYARAIAAATRAGAMPPWPPGSDSLDLVGREARVLSAAEKDVLARWAAAGTPLGTARAIPAPVAPAPPAAALTLRPAKPYTPRATGGGLDDYHCFLLDPKLAHDTYVTGALIRPQQTALVHHVILYEAAGAQAAAAETRNRSTGGKGWTCFGGPGLPNDLGGSGSALRYGAPQWIAAWVPGHVTNDLPAGTGVLLHAGAKIVMQVHYNLIKGSRPDRSSAVLTTAPVDAAVQPLETMLVAAPVELPCPRGVSAPLCTRQRALDDEVSRYGASAAWLPAGLLYLCGKTLADYPQDVGAGTSIRTSCERRIDRPMTLYGLGGHMHLRGRDIALVLDPGTPGERTLLHIPRWDFHWQDAYYLKEPLPLLPGHTVGVRCTFDNSRAAQPVVAGRVIAPRYVLWGEGTTDEMCLGVLSIRLD